MFLQVTEDFAIAPEKITPTLDASKWPLLLKNYDKLMVRTRPDHHHFPSPAAPRARVKITDDQGFPTTPHADRCHVAKPIPGSHRPLHPDPMRPLAPKASALPN